MALSAFVVPRSETERLSWNRPPTSVADDAGETWPGPKQVWRMKAWRMLACWGAPVGNNFTSLTSAVECGEVKYGFKLRLG